MNQDFIAFAKMNYRIGANGTVRNASNRAVVPNNANEDFGIWAYRNQKSTEGVTPETIAEYFKEWAQEDARIKEEEKKAKKASSAGPSLGIIIKTYLSCEGHHWRISKTWGEIEYLVEGEKSCPRPSDLGQLSDFIFVWANERGLSAKKENIKTYLSTMAAAKSGQTVDSLFETIGYRKTAEAECDECIKGIHETLKINESLEVFTMFLKHWLWLVKRKILGRKVVWEIWLNFFGATGVGKSTLIRALCSPLEEFYLEAQISVFADAARERDKFTKWYVMNFDELTVGAASKFLGDTDAVPEDVQREIKQFMTQEKMTSRNFQTQDQSTRRMTFSPISSANEHLYDIIFDEKTMRRYFEFNCTMNCMDADAAYYDKKDALQKKLLSVWQGVDENKQEGYWNIHSPLWKETRAIQDAYYPTKTTTTLWVDDERVVMAEPGHEMHTLDMYRDYSKWCRERGYKARSERSWIEDVKHIIKGSHTHLRNISICYEGEN